MYILFLCAEVNLMTKNCRRFLCLVLAALMLIPLLPASVSNNVAYADDALYGKTIKDNVNFRVGPSMGDKLFFKIPINTVCTVLGTTTQNGYTWYKAEARNPANNFVQTGYIRSDCFRMLSAEEQAAYTGTAPTVTAAVPSIGETSTDTAAAAGTVGYITNDGVNFRMEPNGQVIESLNRGTIVTVLTIPSVISAENWYKVEYNGRTGYIMSTFLNLNGSAPVVTPVVTAQPSNPDALGYVMTIKGSVNIRASVGGTSLTTVGKYVTMPYLLTPVRNGNYTWYFVQVNASLKGYIRSDCVKVVSGPGGDGGIVPTSAPTAAPSAVSGYVKTTMDYVNVRTGVWGNVIYVVQKGGTVYPFYNFTVANGITWYYIYSPAFGYAYIHGNFVTVTDEGGSSETPVPPVTAVPTSTVPPSVVTPTPTPAPLTPTGYVSTTVDAVNVRADAWGKLLGQIQKKGTVMPYYGAPKVVSGNNWYYVNVPNIGYGYILGKFLKLTDEGGSSVTPTPTPGSPAIITPSPMVVNTPESGQTTDVVSEASYTTLKAGSSGPAVQNLVQELINQGYYKYALTSNYTSSVENAVRAFQAAKGLATDGIAGSNTQHALFNTVPVGTADRTNMAMTIYPAEKIDWNTGGIQELWQKGSNVKVYDVKTGLVWWAHRWSGGLHVDAEPLSAADTAVLCKIYDVSKASDIKESTHWQRRPCLITIGTRTFACSLYGVPHNLDGDTIKNNNFEGQLCIHFTNSKIHKSGKVDSNHEAAIQYAWENAPNGHK